jgi:transcriptional regulator with XRE-family HTH domain
MTHNRIRELRKSRGMTLEILAGRVGLHHSHLSRLEKGERLLMIPMAEKIARELGYSPQEVLGYAASVSLASTPTNSGLQEDLAPYTLSENDPLTAMQGSSTYLFSVRTNALSKAGILFGDIVAVTDDAAVCRAPPPLAAVRVRLHPSDNFMKPSSLLRQFVPPRLLITNSMDGNAEPIDMDDHDAHIVGVITSVHRRTSFRD